MEEMVYDAASYLTDDPDEAETLDFNQPFSLPEAPEDEEFLEPLRRQQEAQQAASVPEDPLLQRVAESLTAQRHGTRHRAILRVQEPDDLQRGCVVDARGAGVERLGVPRVLKVQDPAFGPLPLSHVSVRWPPLRNR